MKEEVVKGDGPYKDSAVIREGNLIGLSGNFRGS
jgi:hypothetical protein